MLAIQASRDAIRVVGGPSCVRSCSAALVQRIQGLSHSRTNLLPCAGSRLVRSMAFASGALVLTHSMPFSALALVS
jgi:hypothetical protein